MEMLPQHKLKQSVEEIRQIVEVIQRHDRTVKRFLSKDVERGSNQLITDYYSRLSTLHGSLCGDMTSKPTMMKTSHAINSLTNEVIRHNDSLQKEIMDSKASFRLKIMGQNTSRYIYVFLAACGSIELTCVMFKILPRYSGVAGVALILVGAYGLLSDKPDVRVLQQALDELECMRRETSQLHNRLKLVQHQMPYID